MTRFVTHCRLLSLAALFVVSSPFGCAHPDPQASELDALAKSFSVFRATLEELEAEIRSSPSYGTDAEQVGGYRHMLRALAKSMEAEILQDPDYPYFRILDFWLREGGDNPDQHYAFSPIRGGESYRIWGEMGSAVRVEFQIYAGKPWAGTGRSAGYLIFDELEIAGDGSFEVHVSAEQRDGNWMPNPNQEFVCASEQVRDHHHRRCGQEAEGGVQGDFARQVPAKGPIQSHAHMLIAHPAAGEWLQDADETSDERRW